MSPGHRQPRPLPCSPSHVPSRLAEPWSCRGAAPGAAPRAGAPSQCSQSAHPAWSSQRGLQLGRQRGAAGGSHLRLAWVVLPKLGINDFESFLPEISSPPALCPRDLGPFSLFGGNQSHALMLRIRGGSSEAAGLRKEPEPPHTQGWAGRAGSSGELCFPSQPKGGSGRARSRAVPHLRLSPHAARGALGARGGAGPCAEPAPRCDWALLPSVVVLAR